MPLPDIRNQNVRMIDGKLAGLSNLKRLGQVTFSVKNNKVSRIIIMIILIMMMLRWRWLLTWSVIIWRWRMIGPEATSGNDIYNIYNMYIYTIVSVTYIHNFHDNMDISWWYICLFQHLSFCRGSCTISIHSVMFSVGVEQVKSSVSELVLKGVSCISIRKIYPIIII